MKKFLPILIAAIIVAGCGGFYGGMKYAGSKKGSAGARNFIGFDDRGSMGFGQGQGMGRGGSNLVNGEIISKDDTSITVKLNNNRPGDTQNTGGSKIVIISGSTVVTKSVVGAVSDLAVGDNVMITGKANTDGSVTAESIQIRPVVAPTPAASVDGNTNAQPQ